MNVLISFINYRHNTQQQHYTPPTTINNHIESTQPPVLQDERAQSTQHSYATQMRRTISGLDVL
jgi:hypothetical protein